MPPTTGRRRAAAGAIAALATAAQFFATAANAAYIGSSRIDDSGDARQIAILTFESIPTATRAISDMLSSVGDSGTDVSAASVLTWLTMLPSLDCADPSRQASVIFITTEEDLSMANQVAIVPLSPVNGEQLLRKSLARTYGKISGNTVVYCSEPRDVGTLPGLALIITRSVAYVGNGPESLRWIAKNISAGITPSAGKVRDDAAISAFFDAQLTCGALDKLVGDTGATAGDTGIPQAVRLISAFRDQLSSLSSLQLSISANLNVTHLAASLEPRDGTASEFLALPEPSWKPIAALPRDSTGVSIGYPRHFGALLPESIAGNFSGEESYSYFSGLNILNGGPRGADSELAPFLTGESASSFLFTKAKSITARLSVHALRDAAGAAAALDRILAAPADNGAVTVHPRRESDGRTIWGYTSLRRASADSASDFAASVIILLSQLHTVEMTIDGDNLIVVSGAQGTIDKILRAMGETARMKGIDALTKPFAPLPAGETLLGCGDFEPSRCFLLFTKSSDSLAGLSRHLPSHGGGIAWRVSRSDSHAIVELSASASEIFALSMLGRLDQRVIGHAILDVVLGRSKL